MRMLTLDKPVHYGYRPVHDLPTPPSTSRPSPSLIHPDPGQRPAPATLGGSTLSDQLMSSHHRGLPPPAALPPVHQQHPGSGVPQPAPSLAPGPSIPPPASQSQSLGPLPAAPPWHEETAKTWLLAKVEEDKRRQEEEKTRQEEEKTRQEEEKTRQESYRLEQRKIEHEILKTSLQGGIPPPLVPVVFAGMGGGTLSPALLEWAQHLIMSQAPHQQAPALMPPGTASSDHQRRDSQLYGQYPSSGGLPGTPSSVQGPSVAYFGSHPMSPRPRGHSIPGPMPGRAGGSHIPSLHTSVSGGQGNPMHQQQQEAQPSPSIYFHHWQPPTTQAGGRSGSDQPATPSGSSKIKSRS